MKWFIIIFALGWIWCSACENTYNKTHDKIEKTGKKVYDDNKETIKKGAKKAWTVSNLIGYMFGWHSFKK